MESTYNTTSLSTTDRDTLRRTASWARFLAIVGFVACGFMILAALFVGSLLSYFLSMQQEMMQETMLEMGHEPLPIPLESIGPLYAFMLVLSAALYFVPSLLLYQFASRTRLATQGTLDQATFSKALHAHRRFYKFMGILTAIILCFYALFIVGGLLMGGMAAMMR